MASSLSPECTPLKREYDSCFNKWLESYLNLAHANPRPDQKTLVSKGQDLDSTCGEAFKKYSQCLSKDLEAKGVLELIEGARQAEPLKSPEETGFPNYKS